MVLKYNNKGQAAIEFLMTYGWMLLVVLIVGALIFSFVDFGTLLPNKFDLNNNLRGSPTRSVAYSGTYPTVGDQNQVKGIFTYNGARKVLIGPSGAFIKNELGEKCNATNITNLDTGGSVGLGSTTAFLNSQEGVINFDCSGLTSGDLLPGDTISGSVNIFVKDPKSNLDIPSTGPIRLQIN